MQRRHNISSGVAAVSATPRLVIEIPGHPFFDEVISSLISCKICSEAYSSQRSAHVLRCGHSLCRVCISTIMCCNAQTEMNQLKLSCPFCRDTSTFKNIDELPKNFSILDALEGLSSVKAIIDCQTADNADLKGPSHNGGSRKRAKLTSSATAVTMNANYAGTTDSTGKAHGNGCCRWSDKWAIGQWKNGELFGMAGVFFNDGSIHIGDWVNGVCHGFGLLMTPDGEVRSGVWRQGQCILFP
jgi:hypothetical protein